MDQLFQCPGIRVDVTGNCNLRCPYCINDFSSIRGNVLMSEENFGQFVKLLPLLAPGGQLLFSCYFEPTLHPKFLHFLGTVPEEFRRLGAFTTNLAKRLPDSYFQDLARLGLHHVNVSLDSLDPAVFEEMREKVRFETFSNNLDRLVSALSSGSGQTEVRFISMVSKLNLKEIPSLIRQCAERYYPARHEVRSIWLTEEIENRPWMKQNSLSLEDFLEFRRSLQKTPDHVDIVYDLPQNSESYSPFPSSSDLRYRAFLEGLDDPILQRSHSSPLGPVLRVSSDGRVHFLIADPEVTVNLQDAADPLEAVRQIVFLQNLNIQRSNLLRESTLHALELRRLATVNQLIQNGDLKLKSRVKDLGCLDELVAKEHRLPGEAGTSYRASGWAVDPSMQGPAGEVLLVASSRRKHWVIATPKPGSERIDVALQFDQGCFLHSGWNAHLNLEPLVGRLPGKFKLTAYVLDGKTQKAHPIPGATEVEFN